mgnify:CR=1 FL=1
MVISSLLSLDLSLWLCRDKKEKRREKQNRNRNGETSPTHNTTQANGKKFEMPAAKDVSFFTVLVLREIIFSMHCCKWIHILEKRGFLTLRLLKATFPVSLYFLEQNGSLKFVFCLKSKLLLFEEISIRNKNENHS